MSTTNEEQTTVADNPVKKESEIEQSKAETEIVKEKKDSVETIQEQKKLEEQPKQGLLDKPLVIEGKRERHSVNRLISTPVSTIKKPAVEISGSGVPLGEIEFVNFAINKEHSERLKTFHRVLYGNQGKNGLRKKDLRKFNGFGFEVGSAEFEKKKALLMKLNFSEVHDIRRILGSECGHNKAEEVMNILKFLQKPCDLGLKVPKGKRRKRCKRSSSSPKKPKRGKPISAAKVEVGDDESGNSDGSNNSGDEENDSTDPESNSQEKKPEKVVPVVKQVKASPKASESERNENAKKKNDEKIVDESSVEPSPSEGNDVEKWGPGGPSDSEMNATIDEILRSVDLVDCTMKQMCQRIAEKFPNLDMLRHKRALKERVKEALDKL